MSDWRYDHDPVLVCDLGLAMVLAWLLGLTAKLAMLMLVLLA